LAAWLQIITATALWITFSTTRLLIEAYGELSMYQALMALLAEGDYSVAESFVLPARQARYRPIPRFLLDSRVGLYLRRATFSSQGLWNHQALALEELGSGKNVVVSTGTASGKSLIFRVASFHQILLHPESRILVFYPLKALAADQFRGWQEMARELEMEPEIVGRIDGSVYFKERDEILEKARIVVMTPDVCHAWMMSRLAIPAVKTFLKQLSYMVMDEAHTLEGVFGSNFSFLLRRMLTARRRLMDSASPIEEPQLIAATATIANPAEHMQTLTGMEFYQVTEADEGSPHAERFCAHVISPDGEAMNLARTIQTELLKNSSRGGFITFVDSRKGVEVLARSSQAILSKSGNDVVMPYRAGYDSADREAIERRLQEGTLRGVVSTSALELGIDLPHLTVGLNIGVPGTRKAYRQRLGRVGRSSEGAFLIVADQNAFRSFGTSFEEYHNLSVEPSYLYLDNRFMQFAHGRCLADELEAVGAPTALPSHGHWPKGFKEVYNAAKPGGDRPPEFDGIAQLGGDAPQRSYPLRNVGEINFKIAMGENADPFGEVNESQALRECYPGATYLHLAHAYEVVAWSTNALQPFIKVRNTSPGRQTRPRIRTWINTGIMPVDLMEQHFMQSENGFIAECQMQITEKVEGYVDGKTGEYRAYQELRQRNPNMRPRVRNFRTSGVILCIQAGWFKESGVKNHVADWIRSIFSREYSTLPQDVGSAATNISVRSMEGGGIRGDCVVLYDQTYGSLRLTERLYMNFDVILQRLRVSAESTEGKDRDTLIDIASKLENVYASFQVDDHYGSEVLDEVAPPGCLHVFTPGSKVCLRERGKLCTDVEIIQPTWMDGSLKYQVKSPRKYSGSAPVKRWISSEFLEPSADGDDWEYGWWDRETEEFVDPDDETICQNH
jgi:DEAD/DEAH box helicase domain-containing protein